MGRKESALKQLKVLEKKGESLRLAAEWDKPWQSLISTILSARSRDTKTIEVSDVLYRKYRSVSSLAKAKLNDVERIVKPVNFYKNKSKNIITCAKQIVSEHNGKVPKDFDKLVKLRGVGRKTANVFLAHQGGASIGVDTHLSYVSRKLGWSKNVKPEKIEEDLKRIFPKRRWKDLNYIVVRFGQTYRSKRKKDALLTEIKKIR